MIVLADRSRPPPSTRQFVVSCPIVAPLPQAATLLPRFRALREIPADACQPLAHRQDHAPQTSALIGLETSFVTEHEGLTDVAFGSLGDIAPLHSITSSARPSKFSGTLMPRAFAVLRLTINSTFVDCWTGKSAGLSPLRMRPVYVPDSRYKSTRSPP